MSPSLCLLCCVKGFDPYACSSIGVTFPCLFWVTCVLLLCLLCVAPSHQRSMRVRLFCHTHVHVCCCFEASTKLRAACSWSLLQVSVQMRYLLFECLCVVACSRRLLPFRDQRDFAV